MVSSLPILKSDLFLSVDLTYSFMDIPPCCQPGLLIGPLFVLGVQRLAEQLPPNMFEPFSRVTSCQSHITAPFSFSGSPVWWARIPMIRLLMFFIFKPQQRIARTFFFRYHYCGVPKHMAYQEEARLRDPSTDGDIGQYYPDPPCMVYLPTFGLLYG